MGRRYNYPVAVIITSVLVIINPGCKNSDLKDQVLVLTESQKLLMLEKDSLQKLLAEKAGEINRLVTDTVRLNEELDALASKNRSLANISAARAAQLKKAEEVNRELEQKAAAEVEKVQSLQDEVNSLRDRIAAIDSELSASQREKEKLAGDLRREEEKRKADSTAFANRPPPPKEFGWYVNITELSGAFGLGETDVDYARNFFGLTNVFGYSFGRNFTGGIGTGVHFYNGGLMIPLYLDFRYAFGRQKVMPFIVADGGLMLVTEDFGATGAFIHPAFGLRKKLNQKIDIHITAGPLIQNAPSGQRSTFVVLRGGITTRGR